MQVARQSSLAMESVGHSVNKFKSFSEFKKMALIATSANLAPDALKELKERFMEMDTSHTGTLSHDEFIKALEQTSIPRDEIEIMFNIVDQV